ncbi:MAG: hypothetical protein Q4C91_15075 [Eubacteriales bacterium]|nr:hypothetical protein [Eubacteriales bacterium]
MKKRNIKKIIVAGLLLILLVSNCIAFYIIFSGKANKDKEPQSYLVFCDEKRDVSIYSLDTDESRWNIQAQNDINAVMGKVQTLEKNSVVIRAAGNYAYRVKMMEGDSLQVGDKLLVFYSQTSPELVSPADFLYQYGYVVINE